jgi:hypothetical protein
MPRSPLIATALLFAPLLCAQTTQTVPYTSIYTPEIHLGSATEPSTITVPPVIEVSRQSAEPRIGNAPPADTALLSTRHFDFITSPLDQVTPGSMADQSISLGEYARQLRAQKQAKAATKPTPNAMAHPTKSK